VPNRNPADDLPLSLGNKKRRRHPALREVNAKSLALQPPAVDRPCRPLVQLEKEVEAVLRELLMCPQGLLLVREAQGSEQQRRLPAGLVVHLSHLFLSPVTSPRLMV